MTYRLARITGMLALGLVLYLPLEPAILSVLPLEFYWFLRLAPDALIVLVAAGLVLSELRSPSLQARLLILLAAIGLGFTFLDAARGFAVVDTVNALRVVLRYVVLGLTLWRAAPFIPRFPDQFLSAVFVAGMVQIAAGIAEIVIRVADPSLLGLNGLWFVEGTTGRYDRFGFSMVAFVIVVLVRVRYRIDRSSLLVGAAGSVGTFLLVLTASRQAMLALAIAALALATARLPWLRRLAFVAVSAALVVMISLVPSTIRISQNGPDPAGTVSGGPDDPDRGGSGSGTVIITAEKGSSELTVNPNRNFRLYLNAVLMPWAAFQEPVLGFGPYEQTNLHADSRLRNAVVSAGMDWAYATTFTNDSNYASLVIQFGLFLPVLFVLMLGYLTLSALRRSRTPGAPLIQQFALVLAAAFLVAALFGPAFEQRISSSLLWIALFTAFAYRAEEA